MSEFRRQHPVAAVTQLLGVFRQNLIPLIIFLVLGTRNTDGFFWYFFWFGLLSALVLGIVGWLRFTFRVSENELQINKGIFIRKQLFLSKDRIQVINITQGLIQRMFGLVKVEVKSAGSGTENASISAITKEEADELRSLLRSSNVEVNELDEETEEETRRSETLEWNLSSKGLFFAALTSGNFGLIASILGAVSGQLDQFVTEENLEYLFDRLPGYSKISVILWGVFFVFFISYLFSFLGVIFKYYNFKVKKTDTELLITSGLLERKQITVPFNRIQALRFVEGILRQPFGYGMLYVESAGFQQQGKEGSIVLLPFAKKEFVVDFFNDFLDGYEEPEEVITPPKRAFYRFLRRPNYLLLIIVPLVWWVWEFGWIFFGLIIPFSLFGWLRYSDAELSYNKKAMTLKYRVVARTTAYINRNRMQITELTINPFQQWKKLASVHVTAASGAGGKTFGLTDLDYEEASIVYNWPIKNDYGRNNT